MEKTKLFDADVKLKNLELYLALLRKKIEEEMDI